MITSGQSATYAGKTIVVTGATGYVGSALVKALCKARCHLVLVVRRAPSRLGLMPGLADFKVIEGDVSKRVIWQEALREADYVFHLAAHEHRHGSTFNPILDLEVNSLSVLHMLEVCRDQGLSPEIVFASSTNLVSLPSTLPVNEACTDNPRTLYGINKLTAEKYLQFYAQEFGLHTITLRLSNVYGPAPDPDITRRIALNRMIESAVRGGPLILFENQSCIRDHIFIDDVIAAFLAAGIAGERARGEYFIIGTGVGYRISEVVELIADRVGFHTGERPTIECDRAMRLEAVAWRNFVADSSRFRDLCGWSTEVSLVDGIDRTVECCINRMRVKEAEGCGS